MCMNVAQFISMKIICFTTESYANCQVFHTTQENKEEEEKTRLASHTNIFFFCHKYMYGF